MHEITWQTIGFYSAVYSIAFTATIARTVRNTDGLHWRNTVSLGCTSGFLSFGACCFLVNSPSSDSFNPWYFLGGAALLGLLAKEQDQLAKALLSKIMFAGRTMFEERKKDKEENE